MAPGSDTSPSDDPSPWLDFAKVKKQGRSKAEESYDLYDIEEDSIWLHVPKGEWTIAYRLIVQESELVVAELRIFPTDPPDYWTQIGSRWSEDPAVIPLGGLPTGFVRRVKTSEFRRHTKEALEKLRERFGDAAVEELLTAKEVTEPALQPRRTQERQRELAEIALFYVTELEKGNRAPVAALAKHLNVDRNRARDILHDVRRAGMLTKPGRPGIPGGQLTDKARAILANHKEDKNEPERDAG